ncbi:MAG: glutamate formimidoyltransferase [Solirubrobacteraceae bacterium]
MTLLAVPNVSAGRDRTSVAQIAKAFDARLLDVHADPDHNRSVFTLAGDPGELAPAVFNGARVLLELIDLTDHEGSHPRVGVIDVAPIVYLDDSSRGQACAEALVLGDLLGHELGVPVFLYGALAGGRTRAELRRGGPSQMARRIQTGELAPDFGPTGLDPRKGAVLVAARPPLVAFNVDLAAPATQTQAKEIAGLIREGGPEGLRSVRALGLWVEHRGVAQVSTTIEDHRLTAPHEVVEGIARHARVAAIELVGLAPEAALKGISPEVPARGLRSIEDALRITG